MNKKIRTFYGSNLLKEKSADAPYLKDFCGWFLSDELEGSNFDQVFLNDFALFPIHTVTIHQPGYEFWTPTLRYDLQIRKTKLKPPYKFRTKSHYITNNLAEVDFELWHESGTLLSLSRQLVSLLHKR